MRVWKVLRKNGARLVSALALGEWEEVYWNGGPLEVKEAIAFGEKEDADEWATGLNTNSQRTRSVEVWEAEAEGVEDCKVVLDLWWGEWTRPREIVDKTLGRTTLADVLRGWSDLPGWGQIQYTMKHGSLFVAIPPKGTVICEKLTLLEEGAP